MTMRKFLFLKIHGLDDDLYIHKSVFYLNLNVERRSVSFWDKFQQFGTSSANTTCDQLVNKLSLQVCSNLFAFTRDDPVEVGTGLRSINVFHSLEKQLTSAFI